MPGVALPTRWSTRRKYRQAGVSNETARVLGPAPRSCTAECSRRSRRREHGAANSACHGTGGGALVAALLINVACFGAASAAEFRAAWIPVQIAGTPEIVSYTIQRLAAFRVSDVFVDVWNDGVAYFPSPTIRSIAGDEAQGPDLISAALAAARQHGIRVHAWMEYGPMASYGPANNSAFGRAASAKGAVLGEWDGFAWMDLRHWWTQATLCALARDVAAVGGLATVQMDDHFALPSALVGTSKAAQDAVLQAGAKVASCLPAGTSLSLSPAPFNFSREVLNLDWTGWLDQKLVTLMVPQLYRAAFADFAPLFTESDRLLRGTPWSAGIRINGAGLPTPWPEVQLMLNRTYNASAGSTCLGATAWHVGGILDLYPDQFRQVWG